MLSRLQSLRRAIADPRGFTLVETVVAMVCGLIVCSALFAVLEVSLHQTARITGRVQANQLGRTTMTKIVDELRNSCISREFTPIGASATNSSNELIFVSAVGSEAVLKAAATHHIVFNSSKETLTDESYASNGGSWPNFTYSTTPTKTLIGQYIKQSGSTPIFQYYKYASSSNESSTTSGVNTLSAVTPSSATVAKEVASVLITFTAAAPEGKQFKATSELTNQVTLGFSAPSAETPVVAHPCE
jgi:Tfp pilus assembly protein PilW